MFTFFKQISDMFKNDDIVKAYLQDHSTAELLWTITSMRVTAPLEGHLDRIKSRSERTDVHPDDKWDCVAGTLHNYKALVVKYAIHRGEATHYATNAVNRIPNKTWTVDQIQLRLEMIRKMSEVLQKSTGVGRYEYSRMVHDFLVKAHLKVEEKITVKLPLAVNFTDEQRWNWMITVSYTHLTLPTTYEV